MQHVEIKFKVKVAMPDAPTLLKMYGSADVLEAVIEDWNKDPMAILELYQDEIYITEVSRCDPPTEPTLVEHVRKTL